MLLLAHRGYHAGVPANTMAAFAAAVALGVDGIETDVRLSGDGKPVIVHDRVTSQMRAVAELTHRAIVYDAGAIIAGCAAHARIRSVIWDYNIVDAAALEAVAQAGWDNYVYGAMTLAGHRRCAALGLAGLITDYPLHVLSRQSKAGEGKNPHALQTICHSYSR